jgi:hypothetical protein
VNTENTAEDEILHLENAFGIRQQHHMHCHRRIHTQNACHNIPRGKTENAFSNSSQLTLRVTAVDNEVAA